jgi:hypothetical protein
MNTSADISKFQFVPVQSECWILLKPVPRDVGGSLHLTVPSMNRHNKTEPASFSIIPCSAFLWGSFFSYFTMINHEYIQRSIKINKANKSIFMIENNKKFENHVLFMFGVRLGSLPVMLVARSYGVTFTERRLSLLILFITS